MLGALMASGVHAGKPIGLNLVVEGGASHGVTVRTWPCVVNGLRPYEIDQYSTACNVDLVDPVSYLAQQPIWGAYRAVSAGEMIGGALSLAAGGDGKPSLSPLLPGLPAIWILEGYRDVLNEVPYAIATGQTLGDWLAEFLAALGLRAELRGYSNGVVLELLDSAPRGDPLRMTVRSPLDEDDSSSDEDDSSVTVDGESTGGDGSSGGEGDGANPPAATVPWRTRKTAIPVRRRATEQSSSAATPAFRAHPGAADCSTTRPWDRRVPSSRPVRSARC